MVRSSRSAGRRIGGGGVSRAAAARRVAAVQPLESRVLFSGAADFVIHVSVDGLRPDAVTRLGKSAVPNFYRLREEGAFTDNARTDHDYTITLPNHTAQLTGRPVVGDAGHNWTTNTDPLAGQTLHSNKGAYVAGAWDVAHDHGLRTALYASKTKFSVYDTSYDADTAALQGGAPDAFPADGDHGRDKINVYRYDGNSGALTDAFVSAMTGASPFRYAMVHYHDPDSAGHASGWMGSAYLDAVKFVDAQLGKIFAAVTASPALSGRTAVVVSADHGGTGTGHGDANDPLDYTIPFYVWGGGATAGADLYPLNAATRADPGAGRLGNDARPQPIRNGDMANLSLDLLGLPPVPASLFNANQDLLLAPAPPAAAPSASLGSPADNGPADLDPAAGAVRVTAPQPSFRVALDDADGVDDATVTAATLRMTRDGYAFTDYAFAYDAASDTITLTPSSGASFSYARYDLYFNDTKYTATDGAGAPLAATTLRVHVDGSLVQPAAAAFQQGVNGYGGASDTMVQENAPTTAFATTTSLKVDNNEPEGTQRDTQALLRFDGIFGTGAGQVPAGAEIRSARLELNVTNAGNALQVHRMLKSWAPGATWKSMGGGVQADGVEAAAAADAVTGFVNVGVLSIDVLSSVRAWQANPSSNFGWAILPTGGDGVNFDSAEGATRPRLVVEYVTGTPPVAAGDSFATTEDTPLVVAAPGVLANDTDADGSALAAELAAAPAHGAVVLNADGSFTYTPAANFHGTDAFTYRARDNAGVSNTATVVVSVASSPDAPAAGDDGYAVDEDGTLTVPAPGVLANDVDPDADDDPDHAHPLSASLVDGPAHGTLALAADGSFVYTPPADFAGVDAFTYRATSGSGLASAPATVTITVNGVNDAPAAADDSFVVDENAPTRLAVLANDGDVDGDGLAPVVVGGPSNGTVEVNADGTVTYTPAPGFVGADGFSYRASDGALDSNVATVAITVAEVNDPPTARPDAVSTVEETAVTFTAADLLANDSDPEGDSFALVSVGQPAYGTLAADPANPGTYVYTPSADFFGTDTFTYAVADAGGATSTGVVSVHVAGVNDAPAAAADSATTDEDAAVAIPVLANDSDADGDALSAEVVEGPANGTVAAGPGGALVYTPATNFFGTDRFTYAVGDGNGGVATAEVVVTVRAVNDAPSVADDAAATPEDTAVRVAPLANDTDAENDALSVVGTTAPAYGTLADNGDGTFTYTPAVDFAGTDSFTYAVSDGNGGTVTATVRIVVAEVDEPAVSVAAKTPDAAEPSTAGAFTITRTGDLSTDLLVTYAVAGSATAGQDYVTLTGTVTIPAGAASADVVVRPLDDGLVESAETVVLTVLNSAAYDVGAAASAAVTIADDDVPAPAAPTNLQAPGSRVTRTSAELTWTDRSENEQQFVIEISTDGKTWTEAGRVGPNVTRFNATGLLANRTYYFRVYAVNNGGASAYSNVLQVRTRR